MPQFVPKKRNSKYGYTILRKKKHKGLLGVMAGEGQSQESVQPKAN